MSGYMSYEARELSNNFSSCCDRIGRERNSSSSIKQRLGGGRREQLPGEEEQLGEERRGGQLASGDPSGRSAARPPPARAAVTRHGSEPPIGRGEERGKPRGHIRFNKDLTQTTHNSRLFLCVFTKSWKKTLLNVQIQGLQLKNAA